MGTKARLPNNAVITTWMISFFSTPFLFALLKLILLHSEELGYIIMGGNQQKFCDGFVGIFVRVV